MTYLRYPDSYYANYTRIDWDTLNEKKGYSTPIGCIYAAKLLHSVSEGCYSRYFYEGTFTFPYRAKSFMRQTGFKNVAGWDYDFDRVRNMLDKGYPVLISAMHNHNPTKSHAWILNGYLIRSRTVMRRHYKGSNLLSSSSSEEKEKFVRCDFGWGGNSNGFYWSGLFDSDHKLDEGGNRDFNFNNRKRIITYSK